MADWVDSLKIDSPDLVEKYEHQIKRSESFH